MEKAIVNTSNDNELGIGIFEHPERGRCVVVRKLDTYAHSLYFTFHFQAKKDFSKGDPVVEYCGELLDLQEGDQRYHSYTDQNNQGANIGSFMFKINDSKGKKYW